jgi:hypothetical protein
MIDLERLLEALTTEDGLRLHAERLQIWRLCSHASCRRAGACRDPLRCGTRFAEWAGAVKSAARLEHGHDPGMDAFRLELVNRLERLAQTKATDRQDA